MAVRPFDLSRWTGKFRPCIDRDAYIHNQSGILVSGMLMAKLPFLVISQMCQYLDEQVFQDSPCYLIITEHVDGSFSFHTHVTLLNMSCDLCEN